MVASMRFVTPCALAQILAHQLVHAEQQVSPCKEAGLYDDWLSQPSDFLRTDQPKGLQGLHVACIWRPLASADGSAESLQLEIYKDAVDNGKPKTFALPAEAEGSWPEFRKGLKKTLKMSKKTNEWGHLEVKQEFGVFAAYGRRVRSVESALEAKLIFIITGGQWFWPPVREGFIRKLDNLGVELETLSVAPAAFKVRGFLRDSECEELVEVGKGRMVSSPVSLMDKDKGKGAKEFRTSTQARVGKEESPTVRDIDLRVSRLTGVPRGHNEEVQLLRYNKTQYYSAHLDNWDPAFYSDSAWFEHGHNNRMITVFWYLTTVEKGGETIFPRSGGRPQPQDMWSCKDGLKVQPVKGTVILWYSLHPNGNTDPNGLHGACPVEEGMKYSANFWVWNKPKTFGPNPGTIFAEKMDDPEEDYQKSVSKESKKTATKAASDSEHTTHFSYFDLAPSPMMLALIVVPSLLFAASKNVGKTSGKSAAKAGKKGKKQA